jgi:hypothetical protein
VPSNTVHAVPCNPLRTSVNGYTPTLEGGGPVCNPADGRPGAAATACAPAAPTFNAIKAKPRPIVKFRTKGVSFSQVRTSTRQCLPD